MTISRFTRTWVLLATAVSVAGQNGDIERNFGSDTSAAGDDASPSPRKFVKARSGRRRAQNNLGTGYLCGKGADDCNWVNPSPTPRSRIFGGDNFVPKSPPGIFGPGPAPAPMPVPVPVLVPTPVAVHYPQPYPHHPKPVTTYYHPAPTQVHHIPAAPTQVHYIPAAPTQVHVIPAAPTKVQYIPAAPVQVHYAPPTQVNYGHQAHQVQHNSYHSTQNYNAPRPYVPKPVPYQQPYLVSPPYNGQGNYYGGYQQYYGGYEQYYPPVVRPRPVQTFVQPIFYSGPNCGKMGCGGKMGGYGRWGGERKRK